MPSLAETQLDKVDKFSAPTGQKSRNEIEEQIVLIRLIEDRLQELCLLGEGADLHFSKGQECISTGIISCLRPSDYLVVHHRTIAHAVAKGVPLEPLLAELLGKAAGLNGGMAGEMHMSYPPARFMFSFQLVGTCVPVAAGLAWAVKHHLKTDDIVVVFHGDAATSNGQWHEGVNIAALKQVPLLLVCEDNGVAGNVRAKDYLPVPLLKRAAAYGIEADYIEGNDLDQVLRYGREAVDYVRTNSRPFFLGCRTARLGRHKQGMGDLRSKEELAMLALDDPLRAIQMTEERRGEIQAEVLALIERVRALPSAAPVTRKE